MAIKSIGSYNFSTLSVKRLPNNSNKREKSQNHSLNIVSFGIDKRELEGRSLVRKREINPQNISVLQNTEKISKTLSDFIKKDKEDDVSIIKSVKPSFLSEFKQRISENPQKNIVIGISGESASGKSTLCKTITNLSKELKLPIEVLSADNYFNDISDLIAEHGSFDKVLASGYDVDSPDNFYMDQLHDDLEQLANGKDVRIPQYLVNGTGISVPNAIPKKAQKIIVVEGMSTMYSPVRELLDAQIYVDVSPEIQEVRHIERAIRERNQTEEDARNQLAYVREAAKKYILPKKEDSDIILNGDIPKEFYESKVKELFHSFI